MAMSTRKRTMRQSYQSALSPNAFGAPASEEVASPTPSTRRIKLREINESISCALCAGYLIDATTITDCAIPHWFCRSCIVKYLATSSLCPICDTPMQKSNPLLSIRSDKTMQEIVYKLVPRLARREMRDRQQFFAENLQAAESATPEQRGDGGDHKVFYVPEDKISLSLEYGFGDNQTPSNGAAGGGQASHAADYSNRRYLQCLAGMPVAVLKEFVAKKYYPLDENSLVEIMYLEDVLGDDLNLMDVAYIYSWRSSDPMRLFYRIVQKPIKGSRRPLLEKKALSAPKQGPVPEKQPRSCESSVPPTPSPSTSSKSVTVATEQDKSPETSHKRKTETEFVREKLAERNKSKERHVDKSKNESDEAKFKELEKKLERIHNGKKDRPRYHHHHRVREKSRDKERERERNRLLSAEQAREKSLREKLERERNEAARKAPHHHKSSKSPENEVRVNFHSSVTSKGITIVRDVNRSTVASSASATTVSSTNSVATAISCASSTATSASSTSSMATTTSKTSMVSPPASTKSVTTAVCKSPTVSSPASAKPMVSPTSSSKSMASPPTSTKPADPVVSANTTATTVSKNSLVSPPSYMKSLAATVTTKASIVSPPLSANAKVSPTSTKPLFSFYSSNLAAPTILKVSPASSPTSVSSTSSTPPAVSTSSMSMSASAKALVTSASSKSLETIITTKLMARAVSKSAMVSPDSSTKSMVSPTSSSLAAVVASRNSMVSPPSSTKLLGTAASKNSLPSVSSSGKSMATATSSTSSTATAGCTNSMTTVVSSTSGSAGHDEHERPHLSARPFSASVHLKIPRGAPPNPNASYGKISDALAVYSNPHHVKSPFCPDYSRSIRPDPRIHDVAYPKPSRAHGGDALAAGMPWR